MRLIIFWISLWWSITSNARLISIAMIMVLYGGRFLLKPVAILFEINWRAVVVEFFFCSRADNPFWGDEDLFV